MVDTARLTSDGAMPAGERDAILHAMALAAQGLLAADDVQELAGDVLASLGAAISASRLYVVKNRAGADGGLRRTLAFEWCVAGVVPQMGTAEADVPWDGPWDAWARALRAGTPVLGTVGALEPELRHALESRNIRSIAELPLRVAGAWWGSVGIEDGARERAWTAAEIDSVRAVGAIVAAGEQRRRADRQRRDAEDRYRELVEHIPGVTYTDVPGDEGIEMGFVSPQIEQILGVPEVDCAVDAVGFEARGHGHGAKEAPATVLNSLMEITAAGGALGIPGLYVTGDPGGVDEAAKKGALSLSLGTGWAKSLSFTTGQCPVMKYNRQLMMAILHDKVSIAKNVHAKAISLEDAPKGYAEFDAGAATKYVLNPNGYLS